MIKLIIFDLDGTLVDSSVDITNALNYAIAPYGLESLSVEKTISIVGEGLTRLIERIVGEERAEIRTDVVNRFLEYYSRHLADFTRPYPGVHDTIERLSGYRKAIISNKREFLSKKLLEELGLAAFFDVVLGSDSVEERKPSPKPVLKVLEMLSIKPEEAVIVGDSTFDIEAGKAAGVKTVAVSYGFMEKGFLTGADAVIDAAVELVPVLKRLEKE